MRKDKFERVAKNSGFTPIARRPAIHGDVLLAQKYANLDKDFDKPHWQMVWALDRENVDAFQVLFFEFGGFTEKQRIAACLAAADEFVKDNLEVGRFH